MIRGMHAMFYSSEAAGLRTFIWEKLGLPAREGEVEGRFTSMSTVGRMACPLGS